MRRELFLHFSFLFSFFVFVSIFHRYDSLIYWPMWIGGIIGTFLPDVDHIIYFYFVSPTELTSQRFDFLARKKAIRRMLTLLYETRIERKGLIFHTIFFQIIFLILTFWMLTSSSSLIGRGLVLSFALHLSVDQIIDLNDVGNLSNWTKYLPFSLAQTKEKIYWLGSTFLLLIFGFLL